MTGGGDARVFVLLDYFGWPRRRPHSARTERTSDNIPLAPSAMFVQTQKNMALALVLPYRPKTSPLPCM
jgi:hypothetical protein